MEIGDDRYTFTTEYCRDGKKRAVLRFCGDRISESDTKEELQMEALEHATLYGFNDTRWSLVARCGPVVWLCTTLNGRRRYRIVYGADVTDTDSTNEAREQFSFYVQHNAECEGLLEPGI